MASGYLSAENRELSQEFREEAQRLVGDIVGEDVQAATLQSYYNVRCARVARRYKPLSESK